VRCGTDEVEAAVNSAVENVSSVQSALVFQKLLKLSIDILHDGLKAESEIRNTYPLDLVLCCHVNKNKSHIFPTWGCQVGR